MILASHDPSSTRQRETYLESWILNLESYFMIPVQRDSIGYGDQGQESRLNYVPEVTSTCDRVGSVSGTLKVSYMCCWQDLGSQTRNVNSMSYMVIMPIITYHWWYMALYSTLSWGHVIVSAYNDHDIVSVGVDTSLSNYVHVGTCMMHDVLLHVVELFSWSCHEY